MGEVLPPNSIYTEIHIFNSTIQIRVSAIEELYFWNSAAVWYREVNTTENDGWGCVFGRMRVLKFKVLTISYPDISVKEFLWTEVNKKNTTLWKDIELKIKKNKINPKKWIKDVIFMNSILWTINHIGCLRSKRETRNKQLEIARRETAENDAFGSELRTANDWVLQL
ncbi:hypothetical protein CEXT_146031 [Caerostris extrusa]|uniref:Uncharacterized protein n=1 Tax=Caerostris extrusa TaxID=172846 RepID=A0AAV4PC80_CAEEX|nr:hypothetical protein CEXT_146031 [Caerostris extrusa]